MTSELDEELVHAPSRAEWVLVLFRGAALAGLAWIASFLVICALIPEGPTRGTPYDAHMATLVIRTGFSQPRLELMILATILAVVFLPQIAWFMRPRRAALVRRRFFLPVSVDGEVYLLPRPRRARGHRLRRPVRDPPRLRLRATRGTRRGPRSPRA